jgi:cysteine desulfurase
MVDPQSIANAITDETILVSIMHANNEIGTIQPIKQIGDICKKNGILFFVDACQSLGKLELDIHDMKIDLLAATAHKLYGPKGIGFLYVCQKDPKVTLEMQMDGGGHERGFRSGTLPVPLIIGFAKAIEISLRNRESEYSFLRKLRDDLWNGIKKQHPDVILNGSVENGLPHNLNLCFPNLEAETMIMKMKGIACSIGSACSSTNLEPSHVIKALGRDTELAHSAIRFSLGRFNTPKEIENATIEINSVIDTMKFDKRKRKKQIF